MGQLDAIEWKGWQFQVAQNPSTANQHFTQMDSFIFYKAHTVGHALEPALQH
jgi:hypothetical protein